MRLPGWSEPASRKRERVATATSVHRRLRARANTSASEPSAHDAAECFRNWYRHHPPATRETLLAPSQASGTARRCGAGESTQSSFPLTIAAYQRGRREAAYPSRRPGLILGYQAKAPGEGSFPIHENVDPLGRLTQQIPGQIAQPARRRGVRTGPRLHDGSKDVIKKVGIVFYGHASFSPSIEFIVLGSAPVDRVRQNSVPHPLHRVET